ncbi:MAG: response regulator, partial [Candidatus Eisenbacteria bacterium]
GMTHLALQTELNAEQRDYLQTAESCAHSLLNLINDILDISKIEAGRLEFEAIAFSLRDCLAETLKPHALRAGGKGLELILRVQPEVPDVLVGDPGRLRQVLTNLVGNATKFTERGEIFVDVAPIEQTDGAVVLQFSVHDTGVGIPTEKREAIFDAFVQADSGTTRKYGGTGLGLTISKHLVTMMQGRIWVDSVPGQGSTFHFTVGLPLGAESDLERKAIDPEQLTGMPALIVDDNAVNQKVLAEQLRAWGMLPTVVGSGSDALAALWRDQEQTDRRYRLVLLDAMMPVMDGFEVAGHIRRFKEFAPLAIVMLTSSGLSGESGRSRQLGVSAYLMKPASPPELFDAMLTALSERACACGDSAPAAEKAAAAQTPAAAKDPGMEHRSLRVLLAEDNPVNQKLALRLLERMGHGTRLVQTGREAVEVSGAEPFDLILMDVQMPEMDGLEATRTIRRRESERGGRLPIIAMTAHAMKGDRERCLESGMDDYVAKPIRPEELRRVIETVVRTVGAAAQPSRDLQSNPSGEVGCTRPNPAAEIPEGFDFDKALEVFEGDVELMRETAIVFFQDALLQLARMAEAIEAGDALTIERSAHSLKGAAGNFSAARVVAISLQMEAAGRGGNLGEAARLYSSLGKEFERLREAIEARFASRAA